MTNYMMIQPQGRIEEETIQQKNQGIVTILGNSEGCWDTYTTASASSPLRRTLSADMSSKKWLSHHNNMSSSPMKKIASSEELTPKTTANSSSSSSSPSPSPSPSPSSSSEEDYEERKDEFDDAEAERERLEIWSSIQRKKKEEIEKSSSGSGPFDTWSSIMNLKGNEISKSLPLTPYVHPLVKRSKSSLSEKSLEICTESLGSETGSDGCLFSSYPPSESEDSNKDTEQQQQQQQGANEAEEEEYWYNNHAMTHKKSPSPRSFPPPLPSLSLQANKKGPSLHIRPHRDNGRLVLEAVSVPSQNNFNAQRQDGRLVLTFSSAAAAADDDDEVVEENYYDDDEGVEEFEEEFGRFEEDEGDYYYEGEYDDDDEEEEEGVIEESEVVEVGDVESVMMEKAAPLLSNGVTSSVHRLALLMNNHKPIGLVNRNPNWSERFNKGVNLEDVNVVEMEPSSMAQSLPQRVARLIPSAASASAAAASFNFNAYEYYWKTKPTSEFDGKIHNPLAYHQQNNNYSPHKNNYGSKVIFSGDMNQVVSDEQQQLFVLRGKNGDYLVHNLKSCKDSRRPFLLWEPYCIATS